MPPRLSIRLLGAPSVERDGVPVGGAAGQRRVVALLAMLGCDRGGGVARDRLIATLWPEAAPERGRHALAQLVYHTRRVTGAPGLITGSAELRLDPEVAEVDVASADAALRDGRDDLVALWHRGPLLDGFYLAGSAAFEQWLDLERRRRLDEARGALDRLATAAEAEGDRSAALEWMTRRLTLDPLDSVAVERLAGALVAASAPADAVRVIDTHERVLRHTLDVALPPVLTRLRETVRQAPARPMLVQVRDEPATGPVSVLPPTPPRSPTEPPPVPRSPARRAWWVAVPVLLAAGLILWRRAHVPPDVPLPVADVAVAPFRADAVPSGLRWLSDGLADLLATRLEDATGRDVLDAGRAQRVWRQLARELPTVGLLERARRFAGEAPARQIVTGSVTGDAARLVLDARLLDARSGAVRATASASGPLDSLDHLAAQLAMQLATDAQRIPSPAGAVRSLAALRHYLDGRAAERRGGMGDALAAYTAALAADSTFAEAAVRLAWVAWRRNASEPSERALAIALRGRERLSEDDRALLTAVAGPRYPAPADPAEQRAAWELLASRTPDVPEAWRGLGLLYLSHGTVLGMDDPFAASQRALERALALDASDAATWRALAAAVIAAGDTSGMRRLLARLPALPATPVARAMLATALGDAAMARTAAVAFAERDADAWRDAAMAAQHDLLPRAFGTRALTLLQQRVRRATDRVDLLLAQHSAATLADDDVRRRRAIAELESALPGLSAGRRLVVLDAVVAGRDTATLPRTLAQIASDVARPTLDPLHAAAQLADRCVLGLGWAQLGLRDSARSVVRQLRAAPAAVATVPLSTPPAVCADLTDAALAVAERTANAKALVAGVDRLSLSGAAIGDAGRWADVLVGRWYATLGDTTAALAALRRRPFLDGWPRYRTASLTLERALGGR